MLNAILSLFRMILLLLGGYEQIALENLALGEQLAIFQRSVRHPKIRLMDRVFWVCLRKAWKDWKSVLVIVRPETVLDWQRRRFRRYWCRLSQHTNPGRPRTRADIRKLVKTMAEGNVGWGAPRIHGELQKLGIEVAERTVSRLMPKRSTAPSQTWRTFLDNHARDLVSIDFFTVPTARLRVLCVFIVLSHERRRVVHFNVTEHPKAAWRHSRSSKRFRMIRHRAIWFVIEMESMGNTSNTEFREWVFGKCGRLQEARGKILMRSESSEASAANASIT